MPDYADQMAEVFSNNPEFVQAPGGFAERPATKFETRGKKLGHPIRELFYRRR
ncbi:tRNA (guanine-N(7)-)-methyltransferase [compost metagenome]